MNAFIVATEAIQLVFFGLSLIFNVFLNGHVLIKVDEEEEDDEEEDEDEE